jgi:hypothetical protein
MNFAPSQYKLLFPPTKLCNSKICTLSSETLYKYILNFEVWNTKVYNHSPHCNIYKFHFIRTLYNRTYYFVVANQKICMKKLENFHATSHLSKTLYIKIKYLSYLILKTSCLNLWSNILKLWTHYFENFEWISSEAFNTYIHKHWEKKSETKLLT